MEKEYEMRRVGGESLAGSSQEGPSGILGSGTQQKQAESSPSQAGTRGPPPSSSVLLLL